VKDYAASKKRNPELEKTHSAGHAASRSRCGVKRVAREVIGLVEFGRACDAFMVEHVPGYRVRSFSGVDVTTKVLGRAG